MGSYNLNCAITNLPIREDEDVKILFFTERERGSMTEVSQFFKPIFPFFLDATYMDYGRFGFSKSSQKNAEVAKSFFRKNLISVAQGKNKYHDIAVTPESFDMNKVFEYMSERRLFIKHDEPWLKNVHQNDLPEIEGLYTKSSQQVYFAAYKTSVIDRLFAGVFEHQAYDHGNYRDIMFAEKMAEVPTPHSLLGIHGYIGCILRARKMATVPQDDVAAQEKAKEELAELYDTMFERMLAERDNTGNVFDLVIEMSEGLVTRDELTVLCLLHGDRIDIAPFNNDFPFFVSNRDDVVISANDIMEFAVFSQWFDHIYHGTFIPTRYAGQETCHAAHDQMATIVKEVAVDYKQEMDKW